MYGKLQQVIQSEKVRDMGYLKSLSAETGFKDERMCISVRILTRALEAKLIVCSCSRVKDGKVCLLSDIRLDYIAWQTHSSFNNCICRNHFEISIRTKGPLLVCQFRTSE